MTHAATQKARSVVEQKAKDEGIDKHPKFKSVLDEKMDELDSWLDDKPDFVKDVDFIDSGSWAGNGGYGNG